MPVFLLKSILSLGLFLSAFIALFTMFEIYGRTEKKLDVTTLIRLHRINGFLYLLLFLVISYLCIKVMAGTKAELSPRSALHTTFAIAIFVLLCFKVIVVHVYRGFYGKLQVVGPWVAVLTFLLLGTSTGYYLLVTDLGREKSVMKVLEGRRPTAQTAAVAPARITLRTDEGSISAGKALFMANCGRCHYSDSTKTLMGPGLQGVLKNPFLPASKRPANPEAIMNQLRNPYMRMPSFAHLSDDEASDIIAFLNTL